MTLSLVTAEPADTLALHRPKLILPIGSGGAGKSFWSRWFIERATRRGAPLDICDADPLSPTRALLPRHAERFDHALRFGLDHQDWLEKKIMTSAEFALPDPRSWSNALRTDRVVRPHARRLGCRGVDPKIGQGYVNAVLGDEPLDVVPAAPSARLADNRHQSNKP